MTSNFSIRAVRLLCALSVLSGLSASAADVVSAPVSAEPPPIREPVVKEEPATEPKSEAAPVVAAPPASASVPQLSPVATAGATVDELKKLKDADKLTEARAAGLEALKSATGEEKKAVEDFLSEIAAPLIFSKRPMAEKVEHTVVAGDTLGALAKQYGTTVDAIRKGNNLSGQVIRLGSRLRILNGKFSITVSKTENTLVLALNEQFLKRYRVGTGQYATTPAGKFSITGKVAQPTWYRPDGKSIPYGDKENLLGTHWMSIDVPGFGLHGTWEPDTIGKQSSQGCVRLANTDIEELFTLVPEGTPVIITD